MIPLKKNHPILAAGLLMVTLAGIANGEEVAQAVSGSDPVPTAEASATEAPATGPSQEAATAGIDPDAVPEAPRKAGSSAAPTPANAPTPVATEGQAQAVARGPVGIPLSIAPKPVAADTGEVAVLQKVEIVGRKQVSYKNDVSFGATRSAARLKDVPQAVSYVTKELMQDQVAMNTGELAKNMSGVHQSYNNDFTIRGFRTLGPGLINGLGFSGGVWIHPVTWNLERYEVIKGPASALFGHADPGGTVNMVTKKPLGTERQAVSFTTGSFNTYRSTLDFTGPLNPEKTLLYRLNVGYENAESFRQLQMHKKLMVAPSVSFLPDDRTRVNVDFVYSTNDGKLDRGQPIFGNAAGYDLFSTPTSFAIAKPNDFQNHRDIYATASLNHQFTDWLSVNASYLKYKYNEDLMEHRTSNTYGVDSAGKQIPNLMQMQTIQRVGANVDDALATYAVAEFALGPTKHQAMVGYDYLQSEVPEGSSASSTASGYRNAANNGVIAKYDPKKKSNYLLDAKGNPVPNVPHFDLTNPDYRLAQIEDYIINSRTQTAPSKDFSHAVYVQDQITLGSVKALLGLRRQYYVNLVNFETPNEGWAEQFAWIPRVGLVWSALKDLNLYGTYAQGFQPQPAAQVAEPERYGGPFESKTSHLLEAGAKADLFRNRLAATFSAYHITQNNVLVNAGDAASPDRMQPQSYVGRGLELEVQGQVTPALSLNANGSWSNTEITKDEDPAKIGEEPAAAPALRGGMWARYNLLHGPLRGIGLAAGGTFTDEQNTNNVAFQLPAAQVYDAALYYNVSKFQLSLKVNNLLDETYWTGGFDSWRIFPGKPRHFYTSVAYTF